MNVVFQHVNGASLAYMLVFTSGRVCSSPSVNVVPPLPFTAGGLALVMARQTINVIMFGDSGVGKTSLLYQLIDSATIRANHDNTEWATSGGVVSFKLQADMIPVTVKIWHSAGPPSKELNTPHLRPEACSAIWGN